MSQSHRLQQQRFELKYLINEDITSALRDFVSGYLELDEYGLKNPNGAYPVHSLYLIRRISRRIRIPSMALRIVLSCGCAIMMIGPKRQYSSKSKRGWTIAS